MNSSVETNQKKNALLMTPSESIFSQLDAMTDELDISADETRAIVGKIIEVLKFYNITYGCAEMILDATRTALSEMKRSMQL